MRRGRMDPFISISHQRSFQALLAVSFIYIFVIYQMPFFLDQIVFQPSSFSSPSSSSSSSSSSHSSSSSSSSLSSSRKLITDALPLSLPLKEEPLIVSTPFRPSKVSFRDAPLASAAPTPSLPQRQNHRHALQVSGLAFRDISVTGAFSELHMVAKAAWKAGRKVFSELEAMKPEEERDNKRSPKNQTTEKCPHSIVMSGTEFLENDKIVVLPCGLTLGSHITLVARPYKAHPKYDPKISVPVEGDQATMVSQFMMELQGLKTVDGEEPPRILHFNPRLKGDWSGKPAIELNTCYRMQWGSAQRCEGWKARADEESVDGLVKCEKWIRDDNSRSEESKTTWWLNRLIGRKEKVPIDWPYPFMEEKLFVLTLSAGLEGYHVNVDGRHVTSFPYRTGFVLEDATGLSLNGDIDLHSVFAGSLPTTHPSFSPKGHLEMLSQWQAAPLPEGPIDLFIGILSAGNHFAERMAVRKSWMQIVAKSPNMVARFFVAMHGRKEINVELKREAEFFNDIVIVPFMDSYDLVVMKTVAICEYGVHAVSAKYIMKCDDDTFVKADSVMSKVKKVRNGGRSLYVGNINYYHKPLRHGKWAVTYEEWPEEDYPPYANGPGYILSSDIAHFIVSEFERHTLRLFKMEDVSMGMWIDQFNATKPVQYVHDLKFCQFGCINGYLTAHYQSPRQMLCMWERVKLGKVQCCNVRR